MIEQTFKDIYDEDLARDAIINDRMEGFREDYLLLHILLRKYKIKSCFEIGTHTGFGTKIIKNALGEDSIVYSLDLPDEEHEKSIQHPLSEGKDGVGYECDLPYTQIRYDSRRFGVDEWLKYPCEAYYCDGEHEFWTVFHETIQMIHQSPKLIIYHDSDMKAVFEGIRIGFSQTRDYKLVRVIDTRILYALKQNICP